MATADSVREKLSGLIDKANAKTSRQDTTLTEAVDALIAGYGSGDGSTTPSVEQATPTISVSTSGLITASATQEAGMVTAGTKTATRQLSTVSGKTVTPGTSEQTAVAASRYTTGAVKVAGDANLVAGNIKSGVSIFGVDGIYKSDGTVEAGALSELHAWEKYVSGSDRITETAVTDVILSYSSKLGTGNPLDSVDYADAISIVDGELVLSDPVTTIGLGNDTRSQIVGKYIYAYNDGRYYRIPTDATISYHTSTYTAYVQADKAFQLTAETGGSFLGIVVSTNSAAYPENGEQDGYQYVYMGTLAGTGGGNGTLPTLTNPGSATDLAEGKELIDGNGNIVTGSVKTYNSQALWNNIAPAVDGTDLKLSVNASTPYLFRKGVAVKSPLSNFGDATAADVVTGKTFTSAAGLKVVGTGTGGSGLVMKSGITTSNVIDTGLSEIQMLVLHKSGVAAQGLVQLVYQKDTGKTVSSYCMSYSTAFSTLGVNEDYKGNVNGGIFTWNGTGSAVLSENTEYNWIAVGTA